MNTTFDDIAAIAKAQADAYSAAYQAGYLEGYRNAMDAAIALVEKNLCAPTVEALRAQGKTP